MMHAYSHLKMKTNSHELRITNFYFYGILFGPNIHIPTSMLHLNILSLLQKNKYKNKMHTCNKPGIRCMSEQKAERLHTKVNSKDWKVHNPRGHYLHTCCECLKKYTVLGWFQYCVIFFMRRQQEMRMRRMSTPSNTT